MKKLFEEVDHGRSRSKPVSLVFQKVKGAMEASPSVSVIKESWLENIRGRGLVRIEGIAGEVKEARFRFRHLGRTFESPWRHERY